jgi:hypothetical protein
MKSNLQINGRRSSFNVPIRHIPHSANGPFLGSRTARPNGLPANTQHGPCITHEPRTLSGHVSPITPCPATAKASHNGTVFPFPWPFRPYAISLQNTDGFWELTFNGSTAVLPHHQILFHVAWLLAKRPADPAKPWVASITSTKLAAKVFDTFRSHFDFRYDAWSRIGTDGDPLAEILRHKQLALEAILDREDELEPIKAEALRELTAVYELQERYVADVAQARDAFAQHLMASLLGLYKRLAAATDLRGYPNHVLRSFALHLLVHLIMPSIQASRSRSGSLTRCVYRP